MDKNNIKKVGVLSDIHGNLIALNSVLEDLKKVDSILCAGDIVGYNPWPGECIEWAKENDIHTVLGNHDRAVVTNNTKYMNSMAAEGIKYTRKVLKREHIEWLKKLPDKKNIFNGRVKIVHGHPKDPDHYTRKSEVEPEILESEEILIMGHTHIQYHKKFDQGLAMNPGSVGQPRDGDPRAAYSVLDLENMTVEERRVKYDIEKVVEKLKKEGLPKRIGERLFKGR